MQRREVLGPGVRLERLLLNHEKTLGFLASGEEFNLGPETRLDSSELFVQ